MVNGGVNGGGDGAIGNYDSSGTVVMMVVGGEK